MVAEARRPFSFTENIAIMFSKSRQEKVMQQLQSLKVKIDAARNGKKSTEAKLTSIHDVWIHYPPDWPQRRDLVLVRDGDWCSSCGQGGVLHLHHRRAINEGGAHRIDNLILLCAECHSEIHGNRKFREQIRSADAPTLIQQRVARINEALAHKKDVQIRYRKVDGSITLRRVTPYALRKLSVNELKKLTGSDAIRKEGRLCLFGYCHLRKADRVFAIDRIKNLELK